MNRPKIRITQEMINYAKDREDELKMARTKTSPYDTVGGLLGEIAFASWYYNGAWREHVKPEENRGKPDFEGLIEIKSSIVPFNQNLNLVVREDYHEKRKPIYVQIIISVLDRENKVIDETTDAIICGFATPEMFDGVIPRQMPMGRGRFTPYKAYMILINNLRPMADFGEAFRIFSNR